MRSLTDSAPLSSKISSMEAFLLWVSKTVSSPDDFQHVCVHLKYALRGSALQHCVKRITPVRVLKWCVCLAGFMFTAILFAVRCTKYMGERGAYGWTWLDQEKRAAAFFASMEPHQDNVRLPVKNSWDPVSCAVAHLPTFYVLHDRFIGRGFYRHDLD